MYRFSKGDFVKRRDGVFLYLVEADFEGVSHSVPCREIYISHKGIFKEDKAYFPPASLVIVTPQTVRQFMITALFNSIIYP